jgi:hypothetical protein
MQQLIDAFKKQGLEINLTDLEAAQQLLIRYEVDVNNISIARVALLKFQNPKWSDAQIIERHLNLQQERASQQQGYGDDVVSGIESEIWTALEQSGALETVAENIRASAIDHVLDILKNGGNSERMNKRFNALGSANHRYQQRSQQQDDVIDVQYIEGNDNVEDVISHALNSTSNNPPKMLTSGENFPTNNYAENKEVDGNGKKPPLSGATPRRLTAQGNMHQENGARNRKR